MAKQATHYFVYLGHSTQTKNRLQEEFSNFLTTLEGTLINADRIEDLKQRIIKKATELNEKHKRCAALTIDFSKLYKDNGIYIQGFYFLTFQILKAYDNN
ncbi:hypothetical protein [Flavobacterium fluviatile]|uniref:hypothetical protein n=1 Tax=Flavobacterium fluviatile TaxID=1862387 RepID=UPI0013D0CA0A|nr:hypothetical protein [Flavobacterium fluviatile]